MHIDWSVIKEWGLQVPAIAMVVAGIIAVVVVCLRYNQVLVKDFRTTVKTIHTETLSHQKEMRLMASEDSRQLRDCLDKSNQVMGRACEMLDRHEEIARQHEDLFREYCRQQRTGEKT